MFVHGWGFPGVRGYFGDRKVAKGKKLVVHSFGLHFADLGECEELVILSGFLRLNRAVLRAMRKKLREDPIQLLQAFYKMASYNGRAPWLEGMIDVDLLAHDLDQMGVGIGEIKVPNISIWIAEGDLIVTKEESEALIDAVPQAEVKRVEGSHMDTITTYYGLERTDLEQFFSGSKVL